MHEYYSIARFRAAYKGRVEPIPDRSQWPHVDLGFKVYPPLLGRRPGRPKVVRIRGCLEKNSSKKKVRCHRCGNFGHFAKTCKEPELGQDGATAATNKRKQPAEDDAGPSQVKKKKTKKKTPKKKKKTPKKKKELKNAAAPPSKVVRSLLNMLNDGQ